MKCFTEAYGELAMVTPDGKSQKKKHYFLITFFVKKHNKHFTTFQIFWRKQIFIMF